MVRHAPLSERQLEVLRWIDDGCPERNWPNATHKSTAIALQSRRLAVVSKRGGVWSAQITEAGRQYLLTGSYPDRHWTAPVAPSAIVPAAGKQLSQVAPTRSVAEGPASLAARPAREPSPNRAEPIIVRLLAGDRELEYDERAEGVALADLLKLSRRVANLPDAKMINAERIGNWASSLYELTLVDDLEAIIAEQPVPVPQRLTRSHAATSAYRGNAAHHDVSDGSLNRAVRIIEGLAREAERRGYAVSAPRSTQRGTAHVEIAVDAYTCWLRIRELNQRGAALLDPADRYGKRLPEWQIARQGVFTSTGRLEISLADRSTYNPKRFADRASKTLEEQLPAVLREVEIRAQLAARERERQRRRAALREQAWQRAMAEARQAYREAKLGEKLIRQAERFRTAELIATYSAALKRELERRPAEEGTSDTVAWIQWMDAYRHQLDPIAELPETPVVRDPSPSDLKPYLTAGWDPWGPD